MTVSSTTNKQSYNGNNSQSVFAYGFKIFADTDIQVYVGTTLKTLSTHYTLSGVGAAGGGNVTFTTGNIPAAGTGNVTILRSLALTQGVDLINYGKFDAEVIESQYDKLTMMVQQLQEQADRTIRFNTTVSDAGGVEITDTVAERSNKVLAYDNAGDLSVANELGEWKGNWATSTAFAPRDLVLDAATNNVYICLVAHTSGTLSSDVSSSKWALVINASAVAASATTATTKASEAAASATTASNQASTSTTKANESAASAATANTKASLATTKASEAVSSASAAASSASAASSSASAGATSATNSGNSATAAASSASSASSAATTAVNAVIDSAPAALNTLNELAAALGDDANFGTTVTNSIATKLPLAGGTMTGNTLHGDNVKSKWGSSSAGDLQIYHDGSNSYIKEAGTGNLNILVNDLRIRNAAGNENLIQANQDGEVAISFNGSRKLATTATGVNVTGTVTADQLSIATDHMVVDANGDIQMRADADVRLTIGSEGTVGNNSSNWIRGAGTQMRFNNAGGGYLFEAVGSAKLLIDSSGMDVTGTVTTDGLIVDGGGNDPAKITVKQTANTSGLEIINYAGSEVQFNNIDSGAMVFKTDDTERFRIDASGRLMAGQNSAYSATGGGTTMLTLTANADSRTDLVVANATNGSNSGAALVLGSYGQDHIIESQSNAQGGALTFVDSTAERMRIDSSSGNVGIGSSSPARKLSVKSASSTVGSFESTGTTALAAFVGSGTTNDEQVRIGAVGNSLVAYAGGAERMRIDSAGKVGILTAPSSTASLNLTTPDSASWGIVIQDSAANGAAIKFLNQGGSPVGNIGITGSSTAYNTSSDYRLKTDVQPMTGATATFKQLKPCSFEWISSGERVDGFLAHELAEVIPAAATGTKDAMCDEEYEVTPATGDVYTAAIAEVATESQVMETVETGSYVNLAGETIVETTEQGVTTDLAETVVQRQDVDGVSTEVEVEVTTKVPTMETVITTPAVAEVIHSSDVAQPETLEEGQNWRETTAQVMATRSVPDMQGIDQSKVVPLLVATVQELVARIEALEA